MARRFGRCPRGERLRAAVPHGHWKASTFVAGLRSSGLTAPLVVDGAMNGETFRAYVEQILAPTLAPGDLVIMDNLGAHKVAGVREAIEARGAALLYLPPYSPDLNPIEQAFAKLKALLRKTAARSIDTLWAALGDLLGRFAPHECSNYFANAGYVRSIRNPLQRTESNRCRLLDIRKIHADASWTIYIRTAFGNSAAMRSMKMRTDGRRPCL